MPGANLKILLIAAGAGALAAGAAHAQSDVFGPATVHGMAELGWTAADGEAGWIDGGFGKGSGSGAGGRHWKGAAALDQAVVEWRPRFSFAVSGVFSAQLQPDVDRRVDLDEAYLKVKAPPFAEGRLSGRAGVFYPPVSLEHGGVGWTTTDLVSASAINSWIGEEVKVGGVEATYARRFGAHEWSATAGVFGWNDTSGTLLSFRGWALHGFRTGQRTEFELPPLSNFMVKKQDDETYPVLELDHRAGYYGRLEWRPPAPVVLEAFYYDNRGNRTAVKDRQWSWETHFLNVGMTWRPDAATTVRAQALTGRTWMGYATPQVWLDMDFDAAYVMATREIGNGALSARLDAFDTRDHTWKTVDDNDEHGWAATIGWRRRLAEHVDLLLEAQHIDSKRPARTLAAEPPRQDQDLLKSALRLHF